MRFTSASLWRKPEVLDCTNYSSRASERGALAAFASPHESSRRGQWAALRANIHPILNPIFILSGDRLVVQSRTPKSLGLNFPRPYGERCGCQTFNAWPHRRCPSKAWILPGLILRKHHGPGLTEQTSPFHAPPLESSSVLLMHRALIDSFL
ncbi:hypothetical protein MPTK1_5g14550 [Marchantia polymorpha subsp. ruderalis]|uniref:Uncharacterized protein n=2 Tax=Marchantia polymorpha TaxID=3197 RepID=A0AAF6BID3_MARPO|nr:hypothetical protein MARPO_0032s0147 [Marchantia polymorpha]BBN11767.1 hypothetical protein Mp_5g14550 [Marchantia polymorpha subsp. ruderalis]|eukprot:PTQ41985.1 hypothetical protein MARPO_0032s0147 [Marchantia polymorpha]